MKQYYNELAEKEGKEEDEGWEKSVQHDKPIHRSR